MICARIQPEGILCCAEEDFKRFLPYMGMVVVLGLTTRQPLWVILCHLPEKGRRVIEDIVEEMKERNREETGTGMKVKKQKK